jgi:hypothetical protein
MSLSCAHCAGHRRTRRLARAFRAVTDAREDQAPSTRSPPGSLRLTSPDERGFEERQVQRKSGRGWKRESPTISGRHGRIRTCDLSLRRGALYPAELRVQSLKNGAKSVLRFRVRHCYGFGYGFKAKIGRCASLQACPYRCPYARSKRRPGCCPDNRPLASRGSAP